MIEGQCLSRKWSVESCEYGTALTVSHLAGASLPARVIRRYRLLIVGSYAVM
jgi:hypothetical protein